MLFVGRSHVKLVIRCLDDYCEALYAQRDLLVRAHRSEIQDMDLPEPTQRAAHDSARLLKYLRYDECLLTVLPLEARVASDRDARSRLR